MQEWINTETEIATPKIQVITKISKWDKYEYNEINGIKYIRGISTSEDSKLFEYKEINNMNILLELLALCKKLEVKYTLYESEISKNITQNDILYILDFCKRNGLPRWGNINDLPVENYCVNGKNNNFDNPKNNMLRDIIPFSTENYIHIPSFIRALHYIKMDFLRVITSHDWDYDINVQPFLTESDKQFLKKVDRRVHSFSLHLYMPHFLPFTTYWNNERAGLFLNCENPIHLSVYYLCVLRQQNEFSTGAIKICKKCGNYFVASNSRMKFCNNPCTRQSYYAKMKRTNLIQNI